MQKDVRILQMQNYGDIRRKVSLPTDLPTSYLTFSYFDTVKTWPLNLKFEDTNLVDIYNKMQSTINENSEKFYNTQQIMLAFTEFEQDDAFIKNKIDKFWNDTEHPLFFVTMVNISLKSNIDNILKRIKEIFKNNEEQYLIYFTFEYNELIIFYKGNRFDEYSKLIMELNFKKLKEKNQILDTITICTFRQGQSDYEDEKFGAHICLGTNNYKKLNKFLEDAEKEGIKIEQKWLLGRNDIELWNPNATLLWLTNFYSKYLNEKDSYITTYKMSVLIKKSDDIINSLTESNLALSHSIFSKSTCSKLKKGIAVLKTNYRKFCDCYDLKYDPVFIRILESVISVINSVYERQYADDLFLCLYLQVSDFIKYMNLLCKIKDITNEQAQDIYKCINSFYLSNISLINSTVQANQQFIQIPHCSAPSFQMPPKIMAYYNILVRHIQNLFCDNKTFCGIIISPKLIDELEVESLALEFTEPNQIISINISEKMIYDLKRTLAVLGHELAHFIGDATRNREVRFKQILIYYINKLLVRLDEKICEYFSNNNIEIFDPISSEDLLNFSYEISENIYNELSLENKELYLRNLEKSLTNLPFILFSKAKNKEKIINDLFIKCECEEFAYKRSLIELFKKRVSLSTEKIEKFNDTINSYLLAEYKNIIVSSIEQIIFIEMLDSDYINNMHSSIVDYTGYLFSETYADMAMVLLFNLTPTDYFSLFANDKSKKDILSGNEHKTELTRVLAVSFALMKKGYWKLNQIEATENYSSFEKEIYFFVQHYSDGGKLLEIFNDYNMDISLITCLMNYLNECMYSLNNNFNSKPSDLDFLRNAYNKINKESSLKSLLDDMRLAEQEFKI